MMRVLDNDQGGSSSGPGVQDKMKKRRWCNANGDGAGRVLLVQGNDRGGVS